jgi:hypothetical protein
LASFLAVPIFFRHFSRHIYTPTSPWPSRLHPSAVLPPVLRSELKSHSHLATLWSSFGTICRLGPRSEPRTLILKFIDPPVDTRSEGHLRKTISYRVERYFYEHLSTRVPRHVKVAKYYPVETVFGEASLVLEDLSHEHPLPVARRTDLDEEQAKVVLWWLAGFHASFWEKVDDIPDKPAPLQARDPLVTPGVWRHGGYWYLATRSESTRSCGAIRTTASSTAARASASSTSCTSFHQRRRRRHAR